MTRFGFKKILSHYKNSNDASLADDKSRSQKFDAQSDHTQNDSSCDNIEPKAATVRKLPTPPPGETVNPKLHDLKPTVRTQFVLGRTMRNNDYSSAAIRRGSYMRRDQSRPSWPAIRNRSKKPKPIRHVGGGVRLCPVCGQRAIDTTFTPDGHNCICDLCNAKIHAALENYNGQSGNYSPCSLDWRQSPQSGNQCQSQGQGQGQATAQSSCPAGNPCEPPPFSIVVLQDCENSALIDQLTTALARTCTQQSNFHNNSSNNNDYSTEYKNNYSSGYPDRAPTCALPAHDYAPPGYIQNPPPTPTGQVYYDDTQNRIYDTPLAQNASQRNGDWTDNEPYTDNYTEKNIAAAPRNNEWAPDPGFCNVRPGQRDPRDNPGPPLYPPSGTGMRRKNGPVNVDNNSYACAADRDDSSGFSGPGCTCNCEFCRNSYENSGRLICLIAQALEIFLENNVREPAANKEKKTKHGGRKSSHSRSASNTGVSAKSSNTKTSAQHKEKEKEKKKFKEKSKSNGKERAKGPPKDKNRTKHAQRQLNYSNFFLPDSEQVPCKYKHSSPCSAACRSGCNKSPGRNNGYSGSAGYNGGCVPTCTASCGKCTNCCAGSRSAEHQSSCVPGCQATCSSSMSSNISAPSRSNQRQARLGGRNRGLPGNPGTGGRNQQSGGRGGAESSAGQSGRSKQPNARSKSPGGNGTKYCRCCNKQQDRFGAGDATNRTPCGCCAGFTGRSMNSQTARPTGNCIHGLQPVAHYRPGMLQFPINYTLRRNGECVRRSLVRTAAGATLHERPHSEEHISNALHDQGRSKPCSRCRSNLQFWH
ncbi:uncharacterized protein LOC115757739 isoform X3 [Drosophila novamexicana]|uniref:uncharacterized protein LOC115757739 isoform X3 n=1 Tax=Drosophila novamexicana TaxID=47314 RepID=UPI0011E5E7E3|nr:uncharacterized protein LOC115757739 isoform X3 [Drosophila novamexicana]